MTKANIAQYSTTAADNADINDISLAENVMKPPAVNNAMREQMAQIAQWTSEGTIASAATCDIGAQAQEFLNVTGTTTITSFGTVRAGTKRTLLFAGALTITHNATSLIMSSGDNYVTAAGDMLTFISEGSGNWRQVVDSSKLNKDGSGISTTAEKGALLSALGAGVLSGFRNKIINGDFVVDENNDSTSLQRYVTDRWFHDWNGTGTAPTVSRQLHTSGQTDVPGNPFYFLRMSQGSAPSGQTTNKLIQRIEYPGTLAGKTATFTIYLKAGSALTLPGLHVIQNFGAGNGVGVNQVVASNLSLTTTWQKFTYTVDIPSVTGKTLGSDGFLEYGIDLPLNSTWTIDFSRASLVQGDATSEDDPFAPRHIQQEALMCERYFRRFMPGIATLRTVTGYADSATIAYMLMQLSPEMRSNPTFIDGGNWTIGYKGANVSATLAGGFSSRAGQITATASSAVLTAGDGVALRTGTSAAYFTLDSEL